MLRAPRARGIHGHEGNGPWFSPRLHRPDKKKRDHHLGGTQGAGDSAHRHYAWQVWGMGDGSEGRGEPDPEGDSEVVMTRIVE